MEFELHDFMKMSGKVWVWYVWTLATRFCPGKLGQAAAGYHWVRCSNVFGKSLRFPYYLTVAGTNPEEMRRKHLTVM